jgi:hypothetical protein
MANHVIYLSPENEEFVGEICRQESCKVSKAVSIILTECRAARSSAPGGGVVSFVDAVIAELWAMGYVRFPTHAEAAAMGWSLDYYKRAAKDRAWISASLHTRSLRSAGAREAAGT